MSDLLVSCIVPVYNGEQYLGEALDSVLAQDYRPLEIVVVDDGSIDGTPDVAAAYGDQITYVARANAGPATARNTGIATASGDFIAFLDADDRWVPGRLRQQVTLLMERPELGFCVGHVQNFWIPELEEEAERLKDTDAARPMAGYVTGTLVARRSLFAEDVGVFDTALGHGDAMDWFVRCRSAGVAGELLPDVLLLRRYHESNRSRVLADRSKNEFLDMLKRQLDQRRQAE